MPKTDQSFDPSGYATVAQRIELFYRNHPNGRIGTELINRDAASVTFKACVYRNETDPAPAATGWATEREGDGDINTVACLENTETSAIGRALANLGFTASKQRPSVEEMRKAAQARTHRACAIPVPSKLHVAEQAPEYGPEYGPEYAHAVADLLTLLAEAERAGLQPVRAQRLRDQLERGLQLTPARISDIEQSLRKWLARRDGAIL
ncbi:MAG: hypothetical protein ACR2GG_09250 [Gemmatimonadaceae bacterium]